MATRTLNIVSCTAVHSGTNNDGEAYTIYEVEALGADGAKVALPLRSFDNLPPGEAEYAVKPYQKPNGETTYTLSKPGGNPGARLGPKVDELRTRLEVLEATVAQLQSDLKAVADGRSEATQPGRVDHEKEITF